MTTLAVEHAPASAALVRHRLAEALKVADVPPSVVGDAMLIVTELISNSVRHAQPLRAGTVIAGWATYDGTVELWATDGGSPGSVPEPQHVDATATGGRGLAIVNALSRDWGVDRQTHTTTVWARITVPADDRIALTAS
ncbi:MAG TPA: ATP-binding protein [Mycobacteriales bacterium]|nr:ATP-binding protein [Mycobacteriales bacterium]